MARKRISNVDRLEKEIYRKKLRALEIERAFDKNMEFLKENYRTMAMRTIMGSARAVQPAGLAGEVALRLLESEKLQDGLISLLSKLADGAGNVIRRVRRKSKEDPSKEDS